MKNFFRKTATWAKAHKVASCLIVAVVAAGGYGATKIFGADEAGVSYEFAEARRGDIVVSVSGTGQVSASDQVDIVAKATGDITWFSAKAGQTVAAGALLGQIDAGDAAFELETARLSYEKLLTVDEDDVRDAESTVANAEDDLEDAYASARSSITAASTDMSDVMVGVDELLDGYLDLKEHQAISERSRDYIDRAADEYYKSKKLLDALIAEYRTLSADTSRGNVERLTDRSYEVAVSVAQLAKYAQDATVYLRDRDDEDSTAGAEAYTTVTGLVSDANAVVSSLASAKSSLASSERALESAEGDLAELEEGPDPLDVRSEDLSVRQKSEALADYSIRAPFAGVIAAVDAKRGDRVSSGAAVATIITEDKIAEISLNEIDAAKVAVGQKATLTFDAVEDLTVQGEVAEVDLIGTVSQGVVSYTVKVSFAVEDGRVKPGMTANAEIVVESREGVLAVPVGAVKTRDDASYVEVPADGGSVRPVEVTMGISNDESIEIVSGLEEGQRYVARTITGAAQPTSQSSAPSLFGGGPGGGTRRPQ